MNEPSDSVNDGAEFAFFPKLYVRFSKAFYYHSWCHLSLFHCIVFLLFIQFVTWFLNLQDVCQSVVQPDLFAIPFASSFSTIPFFYFSSFHWEFTAFTVIFLMGACLLVTGISNFINASSVWLLLITHHRDANVLYIINIGITCFIK